MDHRFCEFPGAIPAGASPASCHHHGASASWREPTESDLPQTVSAEADSFANTRGKCVKCNGTGSTMLGTCDWCGGTGTSLV